MNAIANFCGTDLSDREIGVGRITPSGQASGGKIERNSPVRSRLVADTSVLGAPHNGPTEMVRSV